MGTRCHFYYNFHPVGQGLFSSGLLQFDSQQVRRSFSWVYDCGSLNKPALCSETRRSPIFGGAPLDSLDLMILSHFDRDHVIGLGSLLAEQTLRWLVLPYLTPGQRLLVGAITKPDDTDPDFFRFLVDPVTYLTALSLKIENIVFILPGGELPPPSPPSESRIQPEDSLGRFDEIPKVNEKKFPEDPSMHQPKADGWPGTVWYADGGQPFGLTGLWEFCFYNLPRPKLEHDLWNSMKDYYLKFWKQPEHDRDYDRFIRKLREVYDQVFGSRGPDRNDISLVTYTGPLTSDACTKMLWCPWPRENLPIYYLITFPVDEAGLLYCGDITMTDGTRALTKAHFGNRWSQIQVLQVPHHGSKYSWQIASPPAPWPQSWSVFSSARTGRYRHPHKEVVNALANNSPVFVNEFQGAHWGGYIKWP